MAFIGIISIDRNNLSVKRFLENNLNMIYKKYTIIIINNKNIKNIRNIKFETILVLNLDGICDKDDINNIFRNTRNLIINADLDDDNLKLINYLNINVITFGFNQKSTITASSVEDELIICVQRRIIDINGKAIIPQEIKVNKICKRISNNTHNLIGIASLLLIYNKI